MKLKTAKQIYDYVPKDAKGAIFILGMNDSSSMFVNLVVREMTNTKKQLQRAILIFEKGVPQSETKRLAYRIGDKIKAKQPEGKDMHIKVIGNIGRSEIKRLAEHYAKEGKTKLWYNQRGKNELTTSTPHFLGIPPTFQKA